MVSNYVWKHEIGTSGIHFDIGSDEGMRLKSSLGHSDGRSVKYRNGLQLVHIMSNSLEASKQHRPPDTQYQNYINSRRSIHLWREVTHWSVLCKNLPLKTYTVCASLATVGMRVEWGWSVSLILPFISSCFIITIIGSSCLSVSLKVGKEFFSMCSW